MDRLPFKHINPSLTSAAIRRAGAPMRRPWAVLEPLTPLPSFPAGLLGLWESPISGSGRKLCHIMSRWDEKAHFNYIQQEDWNCQDRKRGFLSLFLLNYTGCMEAPTVHSQPLREPSLFSPCQLCPSHSLFTFSAQSAAKSCPGGHHLLILVFTEHESLVEELV